ncbi:hypothetical protein MAPG_05511, partial [Magnaporthiopsis poae ATCC 64411]
MVAAASDTDLMVTLTDTSKPSSNAQRLLNVTRENPIIRLGRASKAQAKGRVAAENNALFESPVMSRDHAELVADMEAKTVAVRDVGSTHGTFLNDVAINRNTAHPVKTGDKLRFGVSINRDRDAFTPITVELGIKFANRCGPVTFQVPEDSEIEDTQADHVDVDLTQEPDTEIVDLTSPARSPVSTERADHPVESVRSPIPENPAAPSGSSKDQVSGVYSGLDTLMSIIESGPSNANPVVCDAMSPIHEGGYGRPLLLNDDEEDAVYDQISDDLSEASFEGRRSDLDSEIESNLDSIMESEMGTSGDEDGSDVDSNAESIGSEIHDLFLWGENDSDDNHESDDDSIGGGPVPFTFSSLPQEPLPSPLPLEARGGTTAIPQAVSPYGEATTGSSLTTLRAPSPSD